MVGQVYTIERCTIERCNTERDNTERCTIERCTIERYTIERHTIERYNNIDKACPIHTHTLLGAQTSICYVRCGSIEVIDQWRGQLSLCVCRQEQFHRLAVGEQGLCCIVKQRKALHDKHPTSGRRCGGGCWVCLKALYRQRSMHTVGKACNTLVGCLDGIAVGRTMVFVCSQVPQGETQHGAFSIRTHPPRYQVPLQCD